MRQEDKFDIIIASGDVGGAKALIAVLKILKGTRRSFSVVENGFITSERESDWKIISIETAKKELENNRVKVFLFSTSLKDVVPLELARIGKKNGVPTICILDNWANYAYRMEVDGLQTFIPDVYTMLDELSFQGALEEGICRESLIIAGQPGLSTLAEEYEAWRNRDDNNTICSGKTTKKKSIVFISEPVEADQGGDSGHPYYRGYTEKTVLTKLCQYLQPYSDEIKVSILPHPRENATNLSEIWQSSKGKLKGGLNRLKTGRKAVFESDFVSGMASILLYEAWLLGKPTLSLQPGAIRPELTILSKKKGYRCLTETALWKDELENWLSTDKVIDSKNDSGVIKELESHSQSCFKVLNLIEKYL